jgi:hypothetical protein
MAGPRAWKSLEAQTPEMPLPWDELTGGGRGLALDVAGLPEICQCGQRLVMNALTDGYERRVLVASCSVHGEAGRSSW